MAGFKSGQTIKRELNWGNITISSKHHITVETPTTTVVFHRFGTPRGYYCKNWRYFRQAILTRGLNDLYDVYKYANKFEVSHFVKEMKLASEVDRKIKLKDKEADNGKF